MNFWKGWTRLLEMVPCYWHVDHYWSTQMTLLLWNMNHLLGKFQDCLQALTQKYHIVQNFWGRKHSQILRFWSYLWKFSPQNLCVLYPPMIYILAFGESFLHEMVTSYRSVKFFSLKNFPLDGIPWGVAEWVPGYLYFTTLNHVGEEGGKWLASNDRPTRIHTGENIFHWKFLQYNVHKELSLVKLCPANIFG